MKLPMNVSRANLNTREGVAEWMNGIFDDAGISLEKLTGHQRQLLAAFAYGMIFEAGRGQEGEKPNYQELVCGFLVDVFKYPKRLAGACGESLMEASINRGSRLLREVIERGRVGHRQWQAGKIPAFKGTITRVFRKAGAL